MDTPVKMMIAGGVCLVSSIILFFMVVPGVVKSEVAKQKQLIPGSFSRQMWEKLPHPMTFNVYVFNVTNPAEVTAGEKPILEQIGPFSYDEYKWKTDLRDRESDDTVAYRPENWWFFNKKRSGGLTGNEMVTLPNAILLGIVTMVDRDLPAIMGMVNQVVKDLFRKPKSVYMTVSVRDLLFDGVLINCTVKDVSTRAVCAILEVKKTQEIVKVAKETFKFSFLGGRNGTIGDWMRVNRGIVKPEEIGRLVEFKKKPRLQVWPGENSLCNTLAGNDGTAFPAYLSKTEPIVSYSPDLCRSLALTFDKETVVKEIPTYRYVSGLGDIEGNPDEACFCRPKKICPKKGTMDLSLCVGSPVIVSHPHFYNGLTQYQYGVLGLKPEKEKHEIFAEFEPTTGTPVQAQSRVQFNIEIKKIPQLDVMKKLRTTLHPIMWLEEGIVLPDSVVAIVKNDLLFSLWLLNILKWAFIIGSIGLLVGGKFLQIKRKKNVAVTPIQAASPEKMSNIRESLLTP